MRLTLRTLLAWLDDTLSPAEVREIGKQVSESPFAKELVERVHRVTRQRRLTVPSRSGPDATDPNLVACYLDNELAPEEVTEFEKRCLTSDVHLAEVASVHQILSLIGQKAKVPSEARHRMYQLVKGRESVAPRAARASNSVEPEPVSEPIQPWVTPEPPRRPWIERFGPVAAVVALMLVLCWSAWKSLTPSESQRSRFGPLATTVGPAKNVPPQLVAGGALETEKVAPKESAKAHEDQDREEVAKVGSPKETIKTAPDEAEKPETKISKPEPEETSARPDFPPGVVGRTEKPSGILLRYNPQSRLWEQLTAETPLHHQDRLLSLHPFRSTITLGKAKVELVGETEIWVLSTLPEHAAHLAVAQGRVVLHGPTPAAPFAVQFAKKDIEITPPSGASIGLERLNRRESGAPVASDPILRVFESEGETTLAAGDAKETLSGPGAITYEARGAWSDKDAKPAPSWVVDPKLSPFDLQIGEQFQQLFRGDRPALANLVEGMDSDQKDVRRLTVSALRAVGDITFIVPLLQKADNPVSRRAAIAVLRAYLGQGIEAARDLHTQLQAGVGDDLAGTYEKLLIGYTPKEARVEATYERLVELLSSPDVGVRELALDNLQNLTGRDDLDFDPDRPDAQSKGLKAWKDLLKKHELKPALAPKTDVQPSDAAKSGP